MDVMPLMALRRGFVPIGGCSRGANRCLVLSDRVNGEGLGHGRGLERSVWCWLLFGCE